MSETPRDWLFISTTEKPTPERNKYEIEKRGLKIGAKVSYTLPAYSGLGKEGTQLSGCEILAFTPQNRVRIRMPNPLPFTGKTRKTVFPQFLTLE